MSVRGHIQIKQPIYGNEVLSNYLGNAVYHYLIDKEVYIHTSDDYGAYADTWEIEVSDNLPKIIAELRNNPDALMEYASEGEKDAIKGRASELADFLDEGLKTAKDNGYDWIIIDWY